MSRAWKRYIGAHVALCLVALAFFFYARLMNLLFLDGYIHCFMHDVLRLYCPFCGGTRAFFAMLRLDVAEAFRLNSAVLIAGAVFLIFDLRALVRLCRKQEGALIPPLLWRLAVPYFVLYTVGRNGALFFGLDRAGDLLSYWQGMGALRAVLAILTATLMSVAFLLAIDLFRIKALSRHKPLAAWLSALLAVLLCFLLYRHWWILLLCIPSSIGAAVCLIPR